MLVPSSPSTRALAFEGVSFRYGDAPVLADFSWQLERGSFWAVLGPSGSGKTTLLNLAAGLELPQTGTVQLGGKPVTGPRREVGLMLQDYGLLPWYSAQRNVEVALEIHGYTPREVEERSAEWLKRLELGAFLDQFPARLSGGQRQRVALARLLALGPEVLLLDEPFSAVDELTRERLQKRFFELSRLEGRTGILVTHNIEEAALLADHILLISSTPIQQYTTFDVPFGNQFPDRADPEFSRFTSMLRKEMGLL